MVLTHGFNYFEQLWFLAVKMPGRINVKVYPSFIITRII